MIYVDPAAFHGLKIRGKPVRSCRMVSDEGRDDLLRMAIRLGLPAYWMRRDPVEHFDLTERRRSQAVRYGALPVSLRQFKEIVDMVKAMNMRDIAE